MNRACIERLVRGAIVAAMLGAFAFAGCSSSDNKTGSESARADRSASDPSIIRYPVMRDVPLIAPDGSEYRLSNFRGNVVVLYVFATWHKESVALIDELNVMHNTMKSNRKMVVGVAIDKRGADAVKQLQMRQEISFPIFVNGQDILRDLGGTRELPTTFLLLRDGRVYDKLVGYQSIRQIQDRLTAIVRQRL